MGACASCEAAAVGPVSTAKLILFDGELREFDVPTRVSSILEKDSEFFICDADDMEIDGLVTAVRSDGELRLGQIYFALPRRSMLKRRISGEDLAALAVKASRAVTAPFVFGEGVATTGRSRRRGGGRDFATDLGVILE